MRSKFQSVLNLYGWENPKIGWDHLLLIICQSDTKTALTGQTCIIQKGQLQKKSNMIFDFWSSPLKVGFCIIHPTQINVQLSLHIPSTYCFEFGLTSMMSWINCSRDILSWCKHVRSSFLLKTLSHGNASCPIWNQLTKIHDLDQLLKLVHSHKALSCSNISWWLVPSWRVKIITFYILNLL